jgi:hypothetical protein
VAADRACSWHSLLGRGGIGRRASHRRMI